MKAAGDVFVVSAPSGTGKTTLIHRAREKVAGKGEVAFSVSHTSRSPRRGEIEGRDYHFVTEIEFQRMVDEGKFLETARFNKHLYGTSAEEVFSRTAKGIDVMLEIEVQGAEQVMNKLPDVQSVFVLPPSYEALVQRITDRGLDRPEDIAGRLAVSLSEIRRYERYKYVIINDDLERASEVLAGIILERRHRLDRTKEDVAKVVENFEKAAEQDTVVSTTTGMDE